MRPDTPGWRGIHPDGVLLNQLAPEVDGLVALYVAAPGGRTRYLSKLASGAEVLVADAGGRTRTAMVGRAKIERRPL
ncbi:3-dehydroquinate synthase, partial [Tetrabaena socialis]